MNRRQFLTISTLTLAGALGACGLPGGAGDQQNQDLAQQFLTERNGGTAVAVGTGGPNAPVIGFIQSVDGSKLTVKREMQETTATVQLAAGAKILKHVDVQLSEVKAGDTATAFGTRQGDVFQADLLRLGAGEDVFSAPVIFNRSNSQDAGGAPANRQSANEGEDKVVIGGPGGEDMMPVNGTVETIDGRRIVLKDKAGVSTTVQLADGAKVQKQAEASPAALTVGTFMMASGVRNGDVYQATQVRIMPAQQER